MLRKIFYFMTTVLTLFTTKGLANINGSTLQSFNPTSGNGDFVTVQTAKTLSLGALNLGGFIDQAYNTLPPALDTNNNKFEVKNDILSSDLHFAIGVLPDLEVGASVGSILNAWVNKEQFSEYYKVRGLTDFRVNAKYKFYQKEKWQFAFNLQAEFPQIENDHFYGAGGVPLYAIDLITSVYDGQWAWSANLGYNVRPKGDKIPGGAYEPVGDTILGSLALAHRFSNQAWSAVAEIWGAQPTEGTANYSQMDLTATELLLGAKYKAHEALEYQAGFTKGTRGGISTPDNRLYLGVNYLFNEIWKKKEQSIALPVLVETPPMPKPEPVAVTPPEVGNFVISTINFKSGSAEISAEYTSYLGRFASFIRAKSSYKSVTIKGFSDSTGPKTLNIVLSLKRAESIKKFLVEQGQLSAEKIQTLGLGMDFPIATNKTAAGRKLNRRIEMLVEE